MVDERYNLKAKIRCFSKDGSDRIVESEFKILFRADFRRQNFYCCSVLVFNGVLYGRV